MRLLIILNNQIEATMKLDEASDLMVEGVQNALFEANQDKKQVVPTNVADLNAPDGISADKTDE